MATPGRAVDECTRFMIRKLISQGFTVNAIARMLHISRPTAKKYAFGVDNFTRTRVESSHHAQGNQSR